MSKTKIQSKHCKFRKSEDLSKEKNGKILIKDSNGIISYLLTPKKVKVDNEINPINLIKRMKKKTEEEYPYIYNLYNIPEGFYNPEREKAMQSINIYLRYRKKLIEILQKIIIKFDCFDFTFYQTLFYMDNFLSHDITIDMSQKTILYYLIGYFLCSLKIKETDAYEPAFDTFLDLEKGIYLSPNRISSFELICLKRIEYNIFSYSAYDWLSHLLSNGIIFNTEVDNSNEVIVIKGHRHSLVNTVNKYTVKLLLSITPKDLFFKYCPMYLAFSLIQIAREKYLQKNMIKPKLFLKLISLYGISFDDYKNCYEEIKSEIKKNLKESKPEVENNNEKKKEKENEDPKIIKRYSVDKIEKNFDNKNVYVPSKMRSSIATLSLNKFEKYALSKDEKEKINEANIKNKKTKWERNNHYLIDCSTSEFKSNDNLPLIFMSFNKDKKGLNPINLKQSQVRLFTGNDEQPHDKFKSSDKIAQINTSKIRLVKNKLLTSTKLPRINLEEFTGKNNNKEEDEKKELNINAENGRKRYKLKTDKNLEIKAPFP